MNKCHYCEKPLMPSQKQYCSRHCVGKFLGARGKGVPKKNGTTHSYRAGLNGISRQVVHLRIKNGWSIEAATTEPLHPRGRPGHRSVFLSSKEEDNATSARNARD